MSDLTAATPPPPSADDERLGAARFVFRDGSGTLVARGERARVAVGDGESLPQAVTRTLASAGPGAVVVGAVGFDDRLHDLVVPAEVARTPESPAPRPTGTGVPSGPWDLHPRPAPEEYARAVGDALRAIDGGPVRKVVLARTLTATTPSTIDVRSVLDRLVELNPTAHVFGLRVGPDPGPVLLGASPELLLSRRGRRVVSNPLAGTTTRSPDPEEDARRAHRLAGSAKDRHEHAVVVDQIRERLAPFCRRLDVPDDPELVATPTLWHLSTRIEGELADPAPDALHLAVALHPTAAVCGEPTDRARELISSLERTPRGWYSGLVGWQDHAGDGEWVVTIRCAEIDGRRARLYAGAGIVAGSSPELELAETSAKLRPVLAALGLDTAAREVGTTGRRTDVAAAARTALGTREPGTRESA